MKTRTAITDIVGSRIYFMKLPQDATFPSLVSNRISTTRTYSHSGDSSMTTPRIQYSCFAETYSDAKDLAEQIVSEMSGFKGTAGSSTIYSSFVENELDLLDPESKLYFIPVDLMVTYNG
ncbi:MAG: DUF3168 domain-containing protein [Ignavibacteriaceae bacterium]